MPNSKDNIQPNAPILHAYWVPYTNTLDKPAEAPPDKPDINNVRETMRQAFLRRDVKEVYIDAVAAAGPTFEGSGLGAPIVQKPPDKVSLINRQGTVQQEKIPLDMVRRFDQWRAYTERNDVKIVGWYESWNYAKPNTEIAEAIGTNDETVLNPVTKRDPQNGQPEAFLTNNDGVIHFDPFNPQVIEKQKAALIALAKKPEVNAIALDDHLGLLSTTKKVFTDPQQIQNIRSQIDSGKLPNVTAKLHMKDGKPSLEVTIDLKAAVLQRHPEISSDRGISDKITEQLRTISQEVRAQGKLLIISTNPLDFAQKDTHQDIRRWVQEGLVDKLNVQIYRKDFSSFKSEVDKLKSQLEGLQNKGAKLPQISISLAKSAGGGVPDDVLRQEAEYVRNIKIGGKAVELIGFDYEAFPKQSALPQQGQSYTSDVTKIAYQYLERPNKILGIIPNPLPKGNKEEVKLNNQTYTIERNQNELTVRAKSDMVKHTGESRLIVKAEIQNTDGQLSIRPVVNNVTDQDRANFQQLLQKEKLQIPGSTLKANSPTPSVGAQSAVRASSAQVQAVIDTAKTVVEWYGSGNREKTMSVGRYQINHYQPDSFTDRLTITDNRRGEILRYDKEGSNKVALIPEDVKNFQGMQKFVEHKQTVTKVAFTAQKMAWNYGQMIDPNGPRISNHSYENEHYRIVDNEQGLRIHAKADGREVLNYPRTDRVLISEGLATDSLSPTDVKHFQGMEQQMQQERLVQQSSRNLAQAQSGNSQLTL